MLQVAFKEWAVVCEALARGEQSLILRKGGIAEQTPDGLFAPEHSRYWLYPTFAHQQSTGIKPSAQPLLDAALTDRPPEGQVRLSHFAVTQSVHTLHTLDAALALAPLHVWSEATVRQRFEYRRPVLYAIVVRVYRALVPTTVVESPAYAGCKTWVELDAGLADEAEPVESDRQFKEKLQNVMARL